MIVTNRYATTNRPFPLRAVGTPAPPVGPHSLLFLFIFFDDELVSALIASGTWGSVGVASEVV